MCDVNKANSQNDQNYCNESSLDNITNNATENIGSSNHVPIEYADAIIKQEIDIEPMTYENFDLKCYNCDYSTGLYFHYQRHIEKCNNLNNKPAPENNNEFQKHNANIDTNMQSEVCHKSLKKTGRLKILKRQLCKEKPYSCDICGKRFTQISNISAHKRGVHTKEKPFECEICDKSFSQLGNMQTHMRIHSGERPFKCEECDRAFTQVANLKAHMRIHTDEKPYVCGICHRAFRQLSNLQCHAKMHGVSLNGKKI